jgi:hypothetical protein
VTNINFLPATFAHEQSRKKRTVFRAAIVVLVAVAMGLWYRTASRQVAVLEAQATEAQATVASSFRDEAQIQQLKDQQATLVRQVNLQKQLMPTLTASQVLAVLTNLTPGGVAMTNVSIVGQRVSPDTPATAAGSPTSDKAAKSASAEGPLMIHLAGIAPNEMEVANLVGQLTGHALFRNVKLSFSRPTSVDNLIGREFQIEMEVDMDRTFQIQPAAEVADAR